MPTFTEIEQLEMLADIGTVTGHVDATPSGNGFINGYPVEGDYRRTSEPVQFSDGSVEIGKPYFRITGQTLIDNAIIHGMSIGIDATLWFVTAIETEESGFVRLSLSKTP